MSCDATLVTTVCAQAKYYLNCPSALNPTANSTSPAAYAICTGPSAEGEVCVASCISAFGVPAFGSQALTCSAGRWAGGTGGFAGPLVCATSCLPLAAPQNAASCTLVQVRRINRVHCVTCAL